MYKKPIKLKLFNRNRRVWIYSDKVVIISLARETKPIKERIYASASQVQGLEFQIIDGAKPYYEKITIMSEDLKTKDDVERFFIESENQQHAGTDEHRMESPFGCGSTIRA